MARISTYAWIGISLLVLAVATASFMIGKAATVPTAGAPTARSAPYDTEGLDISADGEVIGDAPMDFGEADSASPNPPPLGSGDIPSWLSWATEQDMQDCLSMSTPDNMEEMECEGSSPLNSTIASYLNQYASEICSSQNSGDPAQVFVTDESDRLFPDFRVHPNSGFTHYMNAYAPDAGIVYCRVQSAAGIVNGNSVRGGLYERAGAASGDQVFMME